MTLTSDDYTREIRRLHGIIAERDELIIQLQNQLAAKSDDDLPTWLPRMQPFQRKLLRMMIARPLVNRRMMELALHGGEMRSEELYSQHMHRLRAALAQVDIMVCTRRGEGHYLTPESKARLKQETITWPVPTTETSAPIETCCPV